MTPSDDSELRSTVGFDPAGVRSVDRTVDAPDRLPRGRFNSESRPAKHPYAGAARAMSAPNGWRIHRVIGRAETVRSTLATVAALSTAVRLKRLSRRCDSAESTPIDNIPSSNHPKETHHESSESSSLPLPRLPWLNLHLRLPSAHRPASLHLRPPVPMRRCLRLPQVLTREASATCDIVAGPQAVRLSTSRGGAYIARNR